MKPKTKLKKIKVKDLKTTQAFSFSENGIPNFYKHPISGYGTPFNLGRRIEFNPETKFVWVKPKIKRKKQFVYLLRLTMDGGGLREGDWWADSGKQGSGWATPDDVAIRSTRKYAKDLQYYLSTEYCIYTEIVCFEEKESKK